jgi:hypothetical protein
MRKMDFVELSTKGSSFLLVSGVKAMKEITFIDQYKDQRLIVDDIVLARTDSSTKSRFLELLREQGVILDDALVSLLNSPKMTKRRFLEHLAKQGIIKLNIVDFNLKYTENRVQSVKIRCKKSVIADFNDLCFTKDSVHRAFVSICGDLTLNNEGGNMHTVSDSESENWMANEFFREHFEIIS